MPDTKEYGYRARNELTEKGKVNQRGLRTEWEHIVPAWEFGHQLQCWQKGKRKYCAQNSTTFSNMEGDLHNLVPAIGEVNADRSNFKYGLIGGKIRSYDQCDTEVDFKNRIFEPKYSIRGNIARIYILKKNIP